MLSQQWNELFSVLAGGIFVLGAVGLFFSTIGASWLAILLTPAFWRSARFSAQCSQPPSSPLKIEILIAAYNEEKMIRETLRSLESNLLQVREAYGELFEYSVTVGLDHCTDSTSQVVEDFANQSSVVIKGIENSGVRGKWNTLRMLVSNSSADWVALVDSGAVWDRGLLLAAWPLMLHSGVMGVAPSYAPWKGGFLERMYWRFEGALKRLENRGGGPVAVYGPSVLYRRLNLIEALSALQGTAWINDDVVVPLMMRLRHPGLRIEFLSGGTHGGWVRDMGIVSDVDVEYRRRRRIIIGNLQWISKILIPRVSIILMAARRFFRVFWAYWILFLFVGLGSKVAIALQEFSGAEQSAKLLLIKVLLVIGGLGALGGLLFSNWIRRVGMAFINGLLIARHWRGLNSQRGVSWS